MNDNNNNSIKSIMSNGSNNDLNGNYLIANAFSSSCFSQRVIKKMKKYQVNNLELYKLRIHYF
jgi:hypothetical protein